MKNDKFNFGSELPLDDASVLQIVKETLEELNIPYENKPGDFFIGDPFSERMQELKYACSFTVSTNGAVFRYSKDEQSPFQERADSSSLLSGVFEGQQIAFAA